jgi:DHA1 family tetracycline resistance protein-like MFS transporter
MTNSAIKSKKSIYFIFATIMLDMIGIGLIMPVLPDVIRRFISDPGQVTENFGYFIAVYAVMQFVASPILGGLSDQFGRRPILLGSLLGAGIDYIFMALAPTLNLLFLGRIIAGLTGASMTVANSYIADISDDSNRSSNFGMIGAAFGIGFIAGPIIGGLLGHFGPEMPFYGAAVLNILNFLFGLFILPESLKKENRRVVNWRKLNPFTTIVNTMKIQGMSLFVLTYALLFLAGNVHPSVWTLYTESKFGWNSIQVGISLSFVGLIYGLSQSILTTKLVPKWGEQKSLVVGIFFSAFGFLLYGLAPYGWMMYGIMVVSALQGLSMPCLQSIMTKKVDVRFQGELQGGLVSVGSVTAILAPLIYTQMFNWGSDSGESMLLGAPYFVATAFGLSALFLVRKSLRNRSTASL